MWCSCHTTTNLIWFESFGVCLRFVSGGMQDYNYVYGQCFEITLELSCCKYPPADQLADFWQENRAALLAYMQQVHLGVKGQVLDVDGNPIPSAVVEVQGRNNICSYKTNKHGEYYRLLLPGTYTFVVRRELQIHTGLVYLNILSLLNLPGWIFFYQFYSYSTSFQNSHNI
ncbi:CBPM Carboxypeptidase, partial [Polyodon spathula]|nr:CBPM Carboxypeptidase [Polyodon spathula]